VLPNHVYISPPFADVTISRGVLHLGTPETRASMAIDLFFETLAEDQGSRAIGVVLSGAASDGARGAKAIKAEGGITFAQDESARFSSMPRAAIAAGSVDFVLPPEKIAKELVRVAHHSYVAGGVDGGASGRLSTADLTKIFTLLNASHDVDFTHYKPATLERRVRRRMLLHRADTVNEYLDYIRENPKELELLYSDMLIRVTGFFRDAEVFEMLKSETIPELVARCEPNTPLRVWVPGCATGEEVYSLAIAFLEVAGECPVQIFGTDISNTAIERARAGIYPDNAVTEVSTERLHTFFTRVDGGVRVAQTVRDCCVFARQDLTKDPPFSKLDMISCRNVLIYLGAVLQRRIMSIFHYALRNDGILLLGSSEAMNSYGDLFDVVDRRFKLYRRRPVVNQRLSAANFVTRVQRPMLVAPHLIEGEASTATTVLREADRVLLARFCPPGVVINENLEIVQFRGRTSPYLEPAPGTATFNLLKMAREGLLAEVHAAVNTARRKEIPVRRGGVRVKTNEHSIVIDLEVIPFVAIGSDRYYAVVFEPAPLPLGGRPSKAKAKAGTSDEKQDVARLRRELEATRDYLQSIIEEQEAMNEELRSANEEIQSSNEELQSTNEELETAKEELQSSNEELITLNEELENRNDELGLVNSDLNNLLTSIEIGVVMLDGNMRVRRANTAAQRILSLLATDVGRPINDMKTTLVIDHLDQMIASVIDNLEVREATVQDRGGRWYSLRIRPYKSHDNKIDGAVLVIIDVDQLRRAAAAPPS